MIRKNADVVFAYVLLLAFFSPVLAFGTGWAWRIFRWAAGW